jgi:Mce-associated membrane protein
MTSTTQGGSERTGSARLPSTTATAPRALCSAQRSRGPSAPFGGAEDHAEPRTPADGRAGAGRRRVRTRPPARRVLWAVTIALLVAAIAVGATLGRARWDQDRAAADAAAALAAGRQFAVNFITMDASTFDADAARVIDGATGQFEAEYAATIDELKPVVTANKTKSTVERVEASLVSATKDTARVIVGVVAPTTNSASTTPQQKTYRLRLDLARVGDTWKVSTLEFVS